MSYRSIYRNTSITSVSDQTIQPSVISLLSDGRDGEADFDGINQMPFATLAGSTYTITRVPVGTNWRIRNGITVVFPCFHGPYLQGTLQVDTGGILHANGNNGSGVTAGAAYSAGTMVANAAGGGGGASGGNNNGGIGGGGTLETGLMQYHVGGNGGAGAASTGGSTGSKSALAATRGITDASIWALGDLLMTQLGLAAPSHGIGGGGGGGNASGAGGGGGASGASLHFCARKVINNGTISANGGDGADGGASAGGGGGGSGGRIRGFVGEWIGNPAIAWGGQGGAAGSGGVAREGHTGLPGTVIINYVTPVLQSKTSLLSSERSSAIINGVLDISGTFTARIWPSKTGSGSGEFTIFEATTPDGLIALRFNKSTPTWDFYVRGTKVLSTDMSLAGPAQVLWGIGDRIDWRIWYNPAGGARSMGIRLGINHCYGYDTVGTASGASLAAMTDATAICDTSNSTWQDLSNSFAASSSITADILGAIVLLGDSILAPRTATFAHNGVSVGSRLGKLRLAAGLTPYPIFSLAKSGGKAVDQLPAWQAYRGRGNSFVKAVYEQTGHNDIAAGDSAATVSANRQLIYNDIRTNNPSAKILGGYLTPTINGLTLAQQTTRLQVDANLLLASNVDSFVTAHRASMKDKNYALRHRDDLTDHSHPNIDGRVLNAQAIHDALVALSI